MNILHVIPYFHPARRFGGAPEAVYDLAKAQVRLGHTVTVLTSDAGIHTAYEHCDFEFTWTNNDSYVACGKTNSLRVYYFPNWFLRFTEKYKLFTAAYCSTDLLHRTHPQIIHLHEVHIPGYKKIANYAQENRIPLFLSPHGSLAPPVHSGLKKILHRFGDPFLRKPWFRKVHTYISLCNNETQQFLRCGTEQNKILQIPYGLPVINNDVSTLPFEITPSDNLKTFLYLGRISQAKGIDNVCKAIVDLWKKKKLQFRFLFCGHDENYVNEMIRKFNRHKIPVHQSQISDQPGIYFQPSIPRKSIPNLFRQVNVTVCPSPYESFGLVPIESLLCETPIIVTTGYGFLDYVELKSESVKMIPPNDSSALAEAIEMYCSSPTKTESNQDTLSIPSWDEIATKHIELYQLSHNPISP